MLNARQLLLGTLAIVPLLLALVLEWKGARSPALAWGYASAGLAGLLAAVLAMRAPEGAAFVPAARIAWGTTALLAVFFAIARAWADLPGHAVEDATRWAALGGGSLAAAWATRSGRVAHAAVAWVPALVLVALAAEAGVPAIRDGLPGVRSAGVLDDPTSTALCGGVALLVAGLLAGSPSFVVRLSSGAVALVAGLAIGASGDAEAFAIGVAALVIATWGRTRRLQDALSITIAVAGTMLGASVATDGGWILAAALALGLGAAAALGPRATARTTDTPEAAARRGQGIHRIALTALVAAMAASIVLLVATRDDAPRPQSLPQDRAASWEEAVDTWREAPAVGHGGGGFERHARSSFSGDDSRDPHSLLLSLAVDAGLLGLALGIAAIVGFAAAARRARDTLETPPAWRATAVARGLAAALLLQMLVWRTALEPVAWLALACAAGAAVATGRPLAGNERAGARVRRWPVMLIALLLATIAAIPLAALGLREQARAGTDADARRAGRAALELQPGAAAVHAFGSAWAGEERTAARELRRHLDDSLRHDGDAILATAELAERWNDDTLARHAQRRLRDADRERS